MKLFVSFLLILGSQIAWAGPLAEYVASLRHVEGPKKIDLGNRFCKKQFALWSTNPQGYEQAMLELGQAYAMFPNESYFTLDLCQNIWISEYANVLKVRHSQSSEQLARTPLLLTQEFLGAPRYLAENIQLFLSQYELKTTTAIPKAPYEILSGMAASERQVDIALGVEQDAKLRELRDAGLGIVGMVQLLGAGSANAGKIWKPLLLIAGVAVGTEFLLTIPKEQRRHELQYQLREIMNELKNPRTQAPRPLLLDELYKAATNLGYFYSLDLFIENAGLGDKFVLPSGDCFVEVRDYLEGKTTTLPNYTKRILEGQECKDAAAVWLSASLFLKEILPADSQAQGVAALLEKRARQTVADYSNAHAHQSWLLECTMKANPMRAYTSLDCDPVTGEVIYLMD